MKEKLKLNRRKVLFLAFAVGMILVGAGVAWATSTLWHMSITWTVEDTTIGVYTDVGCTIPWDHTLTLTGITSPLIRDFYVKNQGNVALDVIIMNEVIAGATQNWSPTSITNLAIGSSVKMTLTLTFTTAGSYTFDFSSSKHV